MLDKYFFIGQVPMDTDPETTELILNDNKNIKQPHLDNSKVKASSICVPPNCGDCIPSAIKNAI